VIHVDRAIVNGVGDRSGCLLVLGRSRLRPPIILLIIDLKEAQ
jgi:hypothetical protein